MISFQDFRQVDGTPIYLQIVRYIQQGLAAGTIQDGDELPSRRVVSALLAVNPNTVQKAFRLLEDEGLATSRAGAKSGIQASPCGRRCWRRRCRPWWTRRGAWG